ncbi:MAG TPA: hypothetical protein VFR04_08105 [Solirubrobacterales bacterium]|nr:hypothetical protein [Solirubrobacterales bacterium]
MKRAILIAAVVALSLAGCGGGSEPSAPDPQAGSAAERPSTEAADAYLAKADAICHEMVQDSLRMGAKFSESPPGGDPLTFTTEELVRPATVILERSARQLRALEPGSGADSFNAYVDLFDPIMSLARNRVRAGEAGDATRAHELELLLVDLSELQRPLAESAGLKACDVDFFQTFTSGTELR